MRRSIVILNLLAGGLASIACASSGGRTIYFAPGTVGRCNGEEFVEVANRGTGTVDVYANASGEIFSPNQGSLIGSASRGTTRISLAGTAVAGRGAGFSASINGQLAQNVSFRRGCEQQS
jgi:hypothetical protein